MVRTQPPPRATPGQALQWLATFLLLLKPVTHRTQEEAEISK